MTTKLSMQQVAHYLDARRHLKAAVWEQGASAHEPARRSEPRSQVRPAGINAQRATAMLASLECVARSPFFRFDLNELSIEHELLRTFVRLNFVDLSGSRMACEFVLRFAEENTVYQREFDTASDLSYGEISGIIELTEHLVCNDRIHSFISSIVAAQERSNPRPSVPLRGLSRTLLDLIAGRNPNQGLLDFIEFTMNLDHFAALDDAKKPALGSVRRALQECFSPFFAAYAVCISRKLVDLTAGSEVDQQEALKRVEAIIAEYFSSPSVTDSYTQSRLMKWAGIQEGMFATVSQTGLSQGPGSTRRDIGLNE